MTWNAEGILSSGRELALLSLLTANDIDVGIITETEIPTSSHRDFNVEGYHTFLPVSHSELLKTAKYRVMVVVRSAIAAQTKIRPDLMHPAEQTIWIQVDLEKGNRFLIGGFYREWSDLPREYAALTRIKDQLQAAASEVDIIVFAGSVNLDTARRCNMRYGRRCLMLAHDNAVAEANMRYLTTGVTYRSHGLHKREDGEARGHEPVLEPRLRDERPRGHGERPCRLDYGPLPRGCSHQGQQGDPDPKDLEEEKLQSPGEAGSPLRTRGLAVVGRVRDQGPG
jgi:hypothetical protein